MNLFKNRKTKKSNLKYMAILLKADNGKYIQVAEKELLLSDTSVSFEGFTGQYIFNEFKTLYQNKNINYMFFIEENKGVICSFNKIVYPIDVKMIESLVKHNIIVGFLALIKNLFDKKDVTGKVLGYIVVGIMGGALGYIVRESMGNTASITLLLHMVGV